MLGSFFYRIIISIIFFIGINLVLYSQGTLSDYNRAYRIKKSYSQSRVLNGNIQPNWIKGTDSFWYVRNTAIGNEYVKVDVKSTQRFLLFNHKVLVFLLSEQIGKKCDPSKLALKNISVSRDLDTIKFEYSGQKWAFFPLDEKLKNEGGLKQLIPKPHWMVVDDEKNGKLVESK